MTDATIARIGPDQRTAVRAATFADVLRSEWTKLHSVRSTFWVLTVTVVLGVGLGAVISAAAAHGYARSSASGKLSWDPAGVSLDGVAVATLPIAVLGVLFMSSEYSSGMIRTSLIAVPKRGRLLAAKSLVFAAVTFVVGEVTSFTAFFVGQALISGHAPHATLGDPGIAQALPVSWRSPVTEFWPTQAGGQLASVHVAAHSLQPWTGFGVMGLFVAIVYAIAWTLLDRRDA